MLKGSTSLGLGIVQQPPNRGHVGVANEVHMVAERLVICVNPPNLDIHHIDPMMFPRGFPITILNGLKGVTILANFLKLTSSPNEDLTSHVERFAKVLIISFVIGHAYYLIWLPSTLANSGYA